MQRESHRLLIPSMLFMLFGCDPKRPSQKPSTSEMAGQYLSSDGRAKGALLVLNNDGTFKLANWPRSGTGHWEIEKQDLSGFYEIVLEYTDQKGNITFTSHGQYLRGERVPYTIEMYIGDPDEGAILFESISSVGK